MIIFVGDAPSKLNKDPNVAFLGAKCHARLLGWIKYLEPGRHTAINSNTPELMYQIELLSKNSQYHFVALGANASKRLKSLDIKHFTLPHPSGLNRQINDKDFVKAKLKHCREWLHNSSYTMA